jgi:hypothetical protein
MAIKKVRSAKSLHYFNGQLLSEDDFLAQQAYHQEAAHRHANSLHTWGVVAGLDVVQQDDRTIGVTPGAAIDASGRQITIDSLQQLPVESNADLAVHVAVAYEQGAEDSDRSSEDGNYTRTTEYASLQTLPDAPAPDGSVLYLAKVRLDKSGLITAIDTSVRRSAGAVIATGSVLTAHLADGSVTLPKLHPAIRSGWTRLPFKPSFFDESGSNARSFLIGVTKARCDAQGAKGTMAIPIPPGANTLKTFVLAGARNTKQLNIELWRCGWITNANRADAEQLLPPDKKAIVGAPFNVSVPINQPLNTFTSAVAVYVEAVGEAEINLVAAEFGWSA